MRITRVLLLVAIIPFILHSGCNFGTGEKEESIDPEEVVFDSDYEVYSGEGDDFFIAIHCEPGRKPLSTEYVEQNWPALTELVVSADRHELKLTLLFNPQWAMYILQNPERKALVKFWESNGHEIGVHHHGPSMDNWNGYTRQQKYQNSGKYIGTVDEMMVLINMLSTSGQVKTACINSEDWDYDFPNDVMYQTSGGSNKLEDLWNVPTEYDWHGQTGLGLTHARYAARGNNVNIDLEEMTELLNQNTNDEVMGIVFHAFEYAENPVPFDSLFQILQDNSIHTSTVSTIMESRE